MKARTIMKTTADARTYKLARMCANDIWGFDPYDRKARQYTDWAQHASWKQNRKAQYKGSGRV